MSIYNNRENTNMLNTIREIGRLNKLLSEMATAYKECINDLREYEPELKEGGMKVCLEDTVSFHYDLLGGLLHRAISDEKIKWCFRKRTGERNES